MRPLVSPWVAVTGVVAFIVLLLAWSRVASAAPDEWLLVISDGKEVVAGVGITHILGPFDKAVRFPAAIHKVQLKAQQVSKEMAGVEVAGFIVWTINRKKEGPFKAYRYLHGLSPQGLAQANAHIQGMAESIIRHQVANLHLTEVIANRAVLRDKVRTEMLAVVEGWGMWLETVEVTDVTVLSQTVFDNLQTEYRQKIFAHAQEIQMNTSKGIAQQKLAHDAELEKQKAVVTAEAQERRMTTDRLLASHRITTEAQVEREKNEANALTEERRLNASNLIALRKLQHEALLEKERAQAREEQLNRELWASLTREKEAAKVAEETHKLRLADLEQEKALKTMQVEKDGEIEELRVRQAIKVTELQTQAELKALKERMEVERNTPPAVLQKAWMQAVKDVYKNLPLKEVKLFNSGSSKGLEGLLPGLAQLYESFKENPQ